MAEGSGDEAMKKKTKKEEAKQPPSRGEALYLALQKQWANSRELRRDFGKGKKP